MNLQDAASLTIPEGGVRNIRDGNGNLLWSSVGYNVRYDGDTYQQTYSGANLYNVNDPYSEYSVVVDDEGWVTLSRNNTGSSVVYVQYYSKKMNVAPDTDYAVVVELKSIKSNNLTNSNNYLNITDTSNTQFSSAAYRLPFTSTNPTQPGTYVNILHTKADVNTSYGFRTFLTVAPGVDQKVTFRISLLADTSVTPETFVYQPYTGGIPAPSPDYPQDIQIVTGEQTVTVRGKNLFYGTNTTSGGVASVWQRSNVTISGTPSATWANITGTLERPLPAGTYTFSTNNPTSLCRFVMRINYDGSNHDIKIEKDTISVTFTVPDGAKIRICYIDQLTRDTQISGTFGLQLEEGSAATAYELYQSRSYNVDLGTTELCKISDYRDYIYKSDDDWYVHKTCGKVVFDGSEDWKYNTNNAVFTLADYLSYAADGTAPVSNYYIGQSNITTYAQVNNNSVALLKSTTNNRLIIKNTTFTTSTAFKNWLSSNNTSLYYPLATATDTQITDDTLIGQLNAVHNWLIRHDYSGTVSGNLPIIINRTGLT